MFRKQMIAGLQEFRDSLFKALRWGLFSAIVAMFSIPSIVKLAPEVSFPDATAYVTVTMTFVMLLHRLGVAKRLIP